MGLPRELIDKILCYSDLWTLKMCSLASRSFYSAARPFIHRRITLGIRSFVRGLSPDMGQLSFETYAQQAEVCHARYLLAAEGRGLLRYGYVREVYLELSQLDHPENVLQLQQLRALETVQTLRIESLVLHQVLPIFDRCFSHFVPTLQSLSLKDTRCEKVQQLMQFICRFPRLDDLTLISPNLGSSLATYAPPGSEGPQPQQHLPLRGDLVLDGTLGLGKSLSGLPGGIHFRSVQVDSDQNDLQILVRACSSSLEALTIRSFKSSKSSTLVPMHLPTERSPTSSSSPAKA